MAHALEVLKDTEGPPQQNDRFIVAIKSVGRRFETPYERTSYEANRRYTDRAVGGPIPNQRWECTFQEVPGGTRLMRAVDAKGAACSSYWNRFRSGQPSANLEKTSRR